MQRRQFLGAVSAPTFSIAPSSLLRSSPIAEVRIYAGLPGNATELIALHKKHGIATIERDPMTFVSSFDSLEQRGTAWNSLAADTAWHTFRDERKLQLVSLIIYERSGSGDWNTCTA